MEIKIRKLEILDIEGFHLPLRPDVIAVFFVLVQWLYWCVGRVLHAFCYKEGPMPPPWLRQGGEGHFQTKGGHTKFFQVSHVFCIYQSI